MILGGIIEIIFGINAEGKSLEDVTEPAHRDWVGSRRPHNRPPSQPEEVPWTPMT